MNGYYPVMMQLRGKRCLIVGGGVVAERKLLGLLDAGADDVQLTSPSVTANIDQLAELGRIRLDRRIYEPNDIQGAWIVFAATDDKQVNAAITAEAERLGIQVNTATDAEQGTFITPSVVRRGDLLIAVTASGASPALSQRIKQELEHKYGVSYEQNTERLRRLREHVLALLIDEQDKRAVLRLAADEAAAAADKQQEVEIEIDQWLDSLMDRLKVLKGG